MKIILNAKKHFNMKKQSYSNQFPRQQDIQQTSIKERADFIFKNLEDKMPKLFEYILKSIEDERINK